MVVSVGDENELVLLDVKTLLGETKAKQKAYLMGQVQLSSSDAVPLENLFSLSTILKLRLVRLL